MGIARCLRVSIKPVKKTMQCALHHSAVLGCDVSAEGRAAAPTWHWSLVEVTAVCHPTGATSFSQLEGGRAAWSDAMSKRHKQLLLSAPKWCQLCYWASSATQNRKCPGRQLPETRTQSWSCLPGHSTDWSVQQEVLCISKGRLHTVQQ